MVSSSRYSTPALWATSAAPNRAAFFVAVATTPQIRYICTNSIKGAQQMPLPVYTATNTAPNWAAITASDTAKLEPIPRAVFIGSPGSIVAVGQDGLSATFAGLSAGQILEIQPSKIMATGTTASSLVALY